MEKNYGFDVEKISMEKSRDYAEEVEANNGKIAAPMGPVSGRSTDIKR